MGFEDVMVPNCKRFIADAMLGKLVKWLRVLGVDVAYDLNAPDRELLRSAVQEGRILLTRDRRLVQRRGISRHLLIESDYYHEQVRQVVQAFDLAAGIRAFTRCLRCNTLLRELPKPAAAGQVPPYVYSTQAEFKWCSACDRVYWGGTHRENMLRQLGVILGERKGTVVQ